MNKMKCPTVGDGGADAEFQGQLPKNSRDTYNLQAGLALIERGLRLLPETDKAASIMCRRLTIDQNLGWPELRSAHYRAMKPKWSPTRHSTGSRQANRSRRS